MLNRYKLGQGSIVLRVKLLDSSKTDGSGLTGLLFSSAGLRISTIADNEAAATVYTQAGSTIETITTLGTYAAPTATKCRFKEVDATNHPGVYEIQIADARFAVANAKSLIVSWSGATNLAQGDVLIALTQVDPYDTSQFLDLVAGVESGWTVRQLFKQLLGMAAGVTSGMATSTALVQNPAGTKTRVTATVDADGNRTPTAWDNS